MQKTFLFVDSTDTKTLTFETICKGLPDPTIIMSVTTAEEACDALHDDTFDAVFLDNTCLSVIERLSNLDNKPVMVLMGEGLEAILKQIQWLHVSNRLLIVNFEPGTEARFWQELTTI